MSFLEHKQPILITSMFGMSHLQSKQLVRLISNNSFKVFLIFFLTTHYSRGAVYRCKSSPESRSLALYRSKSWIGYRFHTPSILSTIHHLIPRRYALSNAYHCSRIGLDRWCFRVGLDRWFYRQSASCPDILKISNLFVRNSTVKLINQRQPNCPENERISSIKTGSCRQSKRSDIRRIVNR